MYPRNHSPLPAFAHLLALLFLLTACLPETPITEPAKIILYGDSLMAGPNIPEAEKLHRRLEAMFHEKGHTGVSVVNMSRTGEMTAGGRERIRAVVEAKPDLVVLGLGANDFLRRKQADEASRNLQKIIETLLRERIMVVLTGVEVPSHLSLHNSQAGEYRPMYNTLVKFYQVPYHKNLLEGVVGKPGMTFEDGLHPNSAGTAAMAKHLFPVINDALRAHLPMRHAAAPQEVR